MNQFDSETLSSSSEAPTSNFSKKNVRLRKIRKIEDQSLLNLSSESDGDDKQQTARRKRPKLSFLPKIDLEENSQQTAINCHKKKVNRSSLKMKSAAFKVKLGKYKIKGKRMQKRELANVKLQTAASKRKSSPETSTSVKRNLKNSMLGQGLFDASDFDNESQISKSSRATKKTIKAKSHTLRNKTKENCVSKINFKEAYVSLIPLEKTNLLSEEQLLQLKPKKEYDSDELPLNTRNFNTPSSVSRQIKSGWGKENSFKKGNPVATITPSAGLAPLCSHVQNYPSCQVIVERLTLEKLKFLTSSKSNKQFLDFAAAQGEMYLSQSNTSDTTMSFYSSPSIIDNASISKKSDSLNKTKQSLVKSRRSSLMSVNNYQEPSFELQIFNPEGSSSPFVPVQEPTAKTSDTETVEITSNVSTSVTKCLTYELEAETESEKTDNLVHAERNSDSRNATYEIQMVQANQSRKSIKIRRVFEELPYYNGDLHCEEELREIKRKSESNTSPRKSRRSSKTKRSSGLTSPPREEDKHALIMHDNNSTYELNKATNVENDVPIAEFKISSSRKPKGTSKSKISTDTSVPTEEDELSSHSTNVNSTYELNVTTNRESLKSILPVENNTFEIEVPNLSRAKNIQSNQNTSNRTLPLSCESQKLNSTYDLETSEVNTAPKNPSSKRSKSCGSLKTNKTPKVLKTQLLTHNSISSVLPSILKKTRFLDYANVTQRRKRRTQKNSNDKSEIGLDDVLAPWDSEFDDTEHCTQAEESQVTSTSSTFETSSAQAANLSDSSDSDQDLSSDLSVASSSSSDSDSTASLNLPQLPLRRFGKDKFERPKASSVLFDKVVMPKSSLKTSNRTMHDAKNHRVTFSNMSVIIIDSDASFSSPVSKPNGTPIPTNFDEDRDEPLAELARQLPLNKRSTAGRTPMHVKPHANSPQFNKTGRISGTPISIKPSAASPQLNRQGMVGRSPLRFKISNNKATENSFASPRFNRKIDSDERSKLLQSTLTASPSSCRNVSSGRVPKRTKMPNFSSMHQRLFDKMPDIKQYLEQKKKRENLILSGCKVPIGNSGLTKSGGKIVSTANNSLGKKTTTKKQLVFDSDAGTSRATSKPSLFSVAPTVTSTPKGKKTLEGYTRYGFRKRLLNIPKKDQIMAVANKCRPVKSKTADSRNEIKGVRSNRRFDLLMQLRKKKMSD